MSNPVFTFKPSKDNLVPFQKRFSRRETTVRKWTFGRSADAVAELVNESTKYKSSRLSNVSDQGTEEIPFVPEENEYSSDLNSDPLVPPSSSFETGSSSSSQETNQEGIEPLRRSPRKQPELVPLNESTEKIKKTQPVDQDSLLSTSEFSEAVKLRRSPRKKLRQENLDTQGQISHEYVGPATASLVLSKTDQLTEVRRSSRKMPDMTQKLEKSLLIESTVNAEGKRFDKTQRKTVLTEEKDMQHKTERVTSSKQQTTKNDDGKAKDGTENTSENDLLSETESLRRSPRKRSKVDILDTLGLRPLGRKQTKIQQEIELSTDSSELPNMDPVLCQSKTHSNKSTTENDSQSKSLRSPRKRPVGRSDNCESEVVSESSLLSEKESIRRSPRKKLNVDQLESSKQSQIKEVGELSTDSSELPTMDPVLSQSKIHLNKSTTENDSQSKSLRSPRQRPVCRSDNCESEVVSESSFLSEKESIRRSPRKKLNVDQLESSKQSQIKEVGELSTDSSELPTMDPVLSQSKIHLNKSTTENDSQSKSLRSPRKRPVCRSDNCESEVVSESSFLSEKESIRRSPRKKLNVDQLESSKQSQIKEVGELSTDYSELPTMDPVISQSKYSTNRDVMEDITQHKVLRTSPKKRHVNNSKNAELINISISPRNRSMSRNKSKREENSQTDSEESGQEESENNEETDKKTEKREEKSESNTNSPLIYKGKQPSHFQSVPKVPRQLRSSSKKMKEVKRNIIIDDVEGSGTTVVLSTEIPDTETEEPLELNKLKSSNKNLQNGIKESKRFRDVDEQHISTAVNPVVIRAENILVEQSEEVDDLEDDFIDEQGKGSDNAIGKGQVTDKVKFPYQLNVKVTPLKVTSKIEHDTKRSANENKNDASKSLDNLTSTEEVVDFYEDSHVLSESQEEAAEGYKSVEDVFASSEDSYIAKHQVNISLNRKQITSDKVGEISSNEDMNIPVTGSDTQVEAPTVKRMRFNDSLPADKSLKLVRLEKLSKSEKNQSTKTIVESISQNSDVQLGAETLYESHCTDHDEMETDSEGQESVEDIGQNKLLPEKSKEPTSVIITPSGPRRKSDGVKKKVRIVSEDAETANQEQSIRMYRGLDRTRKQKNVIDLDIVLESVTSIIEKNKASCTEKLEKKALSSLLAYVREEITKTINRIEDFKSDKSDLSRSKREVKIMRENLMGLQKEKASLVGKIKSMEKESNARLTRISDWLTGMSELMKVKPPKSTRKVEYHTYGDFP